LIGIPEDGATAFPENLFLHNLLDINEYKHERERECDYCKFDGKKTEAVSLCLECKDDMCNNCADAHRKTKITRNHHVIPFKQILHGFAICLQVFDVVCDVWYLTINTLQ
jgi:hypothetical protein